MPTPLMAPLTASDPLENEMGRFCGLYAHSAFANHAGHSSPRLET